MMICCCYYCLSAMGVKIEQVDFRFPVCNSFKPKIYKDQLCYTVDPNLHKDKIDMKGEISLTLAIDYNEDRQFDNKKENEEIVNKEGKGFERIHKQLTNFIIVDTLGEYDTKYLFLHCTHMRSVRQIASVS